MLKKQPTTKPIKQKKKTHNFVFPALEYLVKDTT